MYHIAICDDNSDEAKALIKCIGEYSLREGKNIECHYYCGGAALLEAYEKREYKCSIIFMDIMMQGLDGIATAREIRNLDRTIPIIFLTSSNDYAAESYDVAASGYLLKPLETAKATACIEKCLTQNADRQLTLRIRGQYHYISFGDIKYVESHGHEVCIHLNNEVISFTEKLSELETKLNDRRFLRCHQSYLVNMDYVEKVDDVFILTDKSQIPIRQREKRSMADTYYKYFVNKSLDEK